MFKTLRNLISEFYKIQIIGTLNFQNIKVLKSYLIYQKKMSN